MMTQAETIREPFPGVKHARCRYVRVGVRCERDAMTTWTMCASHSSAGMARTVFVRVMKAHVRSRDVMGS